MLHIKLTGSVITRPPAQRKTVKALGFTKVNQVRIHPDNAAIRGMIAQIKHLVEVEEK